MFIKVKQKYSLSDNLKIFLYFLKTSRILQGGILFLFFPLLGGYLSGILVNENGLNIKALLAGLALPSLAVLGTLYLYYKQKKQGIMEGLFIIDDSGLTKQNDIIKLKRNWDELSHWTETKNFIFIYMKGADFSAFAIQKSLINSFEEYNLLIEFLTHKLNRNKYKFNNGVTTKVKVIRWVFIIFGIVLFIWSITRILNAYSVVSLNNTIGEINNDSRMKREEIREEGIYYDKLDSLVQIDAINQALSLCNKRLVSHPDKKAYIYNDIGGVYNQIGKLDSSIYFYTQAILQTNSYVIAYGNRGWVYYEMGLLEKAIKDLKFAAALNWDYLFALGIVQEEAKLYNNALQSYSQYLEHYPDEEDCKNRLDSLKVKLFKLER